MLDFNSILKILPTLLGSDGNVLQKLLGALGLDADLINSATSAISKIISGQVDFAELIKTALPIIIAFLQNNSNGASQSDAPQNVVGLNPLDGFIDDEIYNDMENYFANDTAS